MTPPIKEHKVRFRMLSGNGITEITMDEWMTKEQAFAYIKSNIGWMHDAEILRVTEIRIAKYTKKDFKKIY